MTILQRLGAIITQRCPVCLRGKVFNSLLGMYKECPVCGVHFERESGYFLNSMFAGYALGFLLLVPTAIVLFWMQVGFVVFSSVIIAETILIWPLIFRYARIIWMHTDQVLDPRPPTPHGPV
jgi:uncharacterized protein (DUF983 family)